MAGWIFRKYRNFWNNIILFSFLDSTGDMSSTETIIRELESILSQFFDPVIASDNARKKEIEQKLYEIKSRADCWNIARKSLEFSSNPMVLWFAVSIIDHIFRTKWMQLQVPQRKTIRDVLFHYICARHSSIPDYVSKSLGNLIVRISLHDWPQEDPEFINKSLQLLKTPATCKTGLLLLRQMADEFSEKNMKLLPKQKENAIIHTKKTLPLLLNTLRAFLEHQFTFTKGTTFATESEQQFAILALEALLHFLGWIPMNEVLNPQLLDILFKYIHLHNDETSLLAFSCVNEILGQNFVPKEFSEFMVNIFNHLFRLLQAITQTGDGLDTFEEEYVDQFTRFTSLFVSQHLKRVEKNESFPIIEFLSLLFQYTFMQTQLEGFLSCLEIWETFLDYIISQQEGDQPSSLHKRYEHGLASLGSELIQKIQYQTNGKLLSSLDTESTQEDDDDSELETYITACLNVIGKIAQLYPAKILQVLSGLVNRAKEFLQIHTALESPSSFTTAQDAEILLRIFSQTACSFNCVDAASGNPLLGLFCQMGQYILANGLQPKHVIFSKVLAQAFGTLRAFTPWIQVNVVGSNEIVATLTSIMELVLQVLSSSLPPIVGISACVLLGSLGNALPMIQLPITQKVLVEAPSLMNSLDLQVQKEFCGAILCILLVPLGDSKQINWDQRFAKTKEIIYQPVLLPYLTEIRSPSFIESGRYTAPEVIKHVKHVTTLTYCLFQKVYPMEKRSKQIVYETTKEVIQATLSLFRTYLQHSAILKEILRFFLELFRSLRKEVGSAFAQQTIGTFMDILKGDKIAELFASKRDSEIEVVEQFLSLLNILMSFPGSTFLNYIPHILQLVVEIYPRISEQDGFIGVKEAIFQVLYMIILTHGNNCRDQELQHAMKAFHYSFQRLSDLVIFKKNLHFLSDLNKRNRLFSKDFFLKDWRNSFLQIFFKVLFDGMHRILEDEIIPVIYDLASVDFSSFFVQVLPAIISPLPILHGAQKSEIIANFTRDTDIPTFSRNIQQMIDSYRFLTTP